MAAFHAIRLIKGYFTKEEILQLITSNFFSILYNNSEIWHLPKLNLILKIHLLAASATTIKLKTPNYCILLRLEKYKTLVGCCTSD
jgi:hypothetical protein